MGLLRTTGIRAIVLGTLAIAAEPAIGLEDAAAPGSRASGTGKPAVIEKTVMDGEEFQIDLGIPGTSTCFVYPEERTDAAACDGLDLETVKGRVMSLADLSNLVAVAILRRGEAQSMAVVLRSREEMAELSEKDFDKVADGLLKGMSKSIQPGAHVELKVEQAAQLMHVGKLELLHLRVALHPFKNAEQVALLVDHYFVLTRHSTKILQFTTVATDMAHMQPVIDRMVQGVRGTPTQKRLDIGGGKTSYFLSQVTTLSVLGLLLIAAGGAGYAIARRRRTSKSG
jgi:hypothetical protein